MLALLQVLGIYSGLAVVAVYGVWRLIGHQGFIGLEDTDSRLAHHFRNPKAAVTNDKRIARA